VWECAIGSRRAASEVVTLDAEGTWDPDSGAVGKDALAFRWFHYWEVSAMQGNRGEVPRFNFTQAGQQGDRRMLNTTIPVAELACATQSGLWQPEDMQEACKRCAGSITLSLEVTGSGTSPIRRYKRVILKVQAPPLIEAKRKRKRKREELRGCLERCDRGSRYL
jgi:hypothetical protein